MKGSAPYYETPVRYFSRPGPRNTRATLESVRRRADELNIGTVLVASCSGETAFHALELLDSRIKIVVVSHVTGFSEPNHQEMPGQVRQELIDKGAAVLTCQHAFGGVGRGIRKKLGAYQVDEIVAYTLRTFGHGTKVAIELALMAADAGLVRTDEEVISVGGTGKGADTALVLRPANSADFLDLVVKEVICKPAWL
ncbi:MAG: pyruvate kinase alpha/beta domain-containing protein [Deltaproteobacteria bacterium]